MDIYIYISIYLYISIYKGRCRARGAGPEGAEGLVRGGLGRRERHQHQRLAVACTPHRLMSE